MAYQMVHDGNYPGTDLPVFKVFDADEYNDTSVKYPRLVGDVWGVGVKGVTGKFIPTGVRWEIAGRMTLDDSNLLPAGAYGDAARAMIAAYEGI
jgi:hypothetical protein